jgi:hypothetical protein
MLPRRMFLSNGLLAMSAAGCSSSEPVSSDLRQGTVAARDAGQRPVVGPETVELTTFTPTGLCLTGWVAARERGFFAAEGFEVGFLPPAVVDTLTDIATASAGFFSTKSAPRRKARVTAFATSGFASTSARRTPIMQQYQPFSGRVQV